MRKQVNRKRGLFITFEGIDGCGKSTQLQLAASYLKKQGYSVTTLREPGSTPAAERIRKILLDNDSHLTAQAELLLYEAARAEITAKEIAPLLDKGTIVLCDRFYDSTTAYQGYGRGLDIQIVKRLHTLATGGLKPDITLVFDLTVAAARKRLPGKRDRLESESSAFFNRVRQGFLKIAKSELRRVKVLDARKSVDEIALGVVKLLNRKLRIRSR